MKLVLTKGFVEQPSGARQQCTTVDSEQLVEFVVEVIKGVMRRAPELNALAQVIKGEKQL